MDDVEEEEEEGDVKRLGGPFDLDVLGTDWEGRREREGGRGKMARKEREQSKPSAGHRVSGAHAAAMSSSLSYSSYSTTATLLLRFVCFSSADADGKKKKKGQKNRKVSH